jgi:uncharacterized protein Usg
MVVIFKRKEFIVVTVRYYMPDYRHILQDFIWETEDLVPDIPRVHRFLNYWKSYIEAPIKEVIVTASTTREYNISNFYKVLQ